jgi:hypothetical protein
MDLGRNPYYELATIMSAGNWLRDGFTLVLHILYDIFN